MQHGAFNSLDGDWRMYNFGIKSQIVIRETKIGHHSLIKRGCELPPPPPRNLEFFSQEPSIANNYMYHSLAVIIRSLSMQLSTHDIHLYNIFASDTLFITGKLSPSKVQVKLSLCTGKEADNYTVPASSWWTMLGYV